LRPWDLHAIETRRRDYDGGEEQRPGTRNVIGGGGHHLRNRWQEVYRCNLRRDERHLEEQWR